MSIHAISPVSLGIGCTGAGGYPNLWIPSLVVCGGSFLTGLVVEAPIHTLQILLGRRWGAFLQFSTGYSPSYPRVHAGPTNLWIRRAQRGDNSWRNCGQVFLLLSMPSQHQLAVDKGGQLSPQKRPNPHCLLYVNCGFVDNAVDCE